MFWDFLSVAYPWVKAIHIMAVISWMAGLFYLPRLFVYHAEKVQTGTETDALFQAMELKLLKVIMNNAMHAAWVAGLLMVLTPGIVDWGAVWPYTVQLFWHDLVSYVVVSPRKEFERGENTLTGRRHRLMNEVPTVLMVIIVVSVVVRPI